MGWENFECVPVLECARDPMPCIAMQLIQRDDQEGCLTAASLKAKNAGFVLNPCRFTDLLQSYRNPQGNQGTRKARP